MTLATPLVRPPQVPIGIAPEPTVGLPLLVSWVLLTAYVATIATVQSPDANTNQHLLRTLEIERALNATINPCTDLYGHSCGNFGRYNAQSTWGRLQAIARHELQLMPEYTACSARGPGHFDRPPINVTCAAQDRVSCHMDLLAQGFAVNDVNARVAAINGTYIMLYWINDDDLIAARTLTPNHAERSEAVKSHLADNLTDVQYSPYMPDACGPAVETFRLASIATRHPTPDGVAALADSLMDEIKHWRTPPLLRVGGGPGIAADVDFDKDNVAMWEEQRLRELALVGTAAPTDRWGVPATTVNAFYSSDDDSVTIPAMMLREPFYHPSYSESLKRGGLGFVLAHELGHAVDHALNDSGLRHAIGHRMAEMSTATYDTVFRTESEDVADHYARTVLDNSGPIDRMLVLQAAQMWCLTSSNWSDVHAPGRWRVNASLSTPGTWSAPFC